VLDMPLLNTQIKMGDLTGIFISDLVLQILAYVSETERVFIRQRQAEGIAVAKLKGVHFGCKRIELEDEADEVFHLYEKKELSAADAAARLHISKSTFYRRYKEIKK
jgi:DNA invertase Pin-like site-specific DNA recombinase